MGILKLSLFLAWKSILKGNRWSLVLIILVMSLSFANLLLTPSILAGITETLNKQQINTLYGNIVIDPQDDDYYLNNAEEIQRKVAQVSGVESVASHLSTSASIEYEWHDKLSFTDKGKSGNWNIVGIEPSRERQVTTIHEHIIEGSYLDTNDRDEILLGVEIAGGEKAETSSFLTLEGVRVGDEVRVTYPNGITRDYTVKGIFKAREITQADRQAFVTRQEMVSVLGQTAFHDRASQIVVKTEPGANQDQVMRDISALSLDTQPRGWQEYGGALAGIVSSFDVIAGLISGIGLIVAGIVMFIVIYINVINKRRQIGIMRAIGIRRDVIVYSYLTQSLFYAALGVIVGGLMFGYGIQPYFESNPLVLPIGLMELAIEASTVRDAVLGLIVAGALAGIIPVLSIIRESIIRSIWG
ncbi:MAG: ABC transporter permease [Dehalococcoidia bacterium]